MSLPSTTAAGDALRFEDLALGDVFASPSRSVTEAHFSHFAAFSGDNHPIHYDRDYCREHGHPDLLAHGFQALSYTAAGAGDFARRIGAVLIAFLDQSSRFRAPLYAGDTVTPRLEVTALERQRTTGVVALRSTLHNHRGQLLLEGEQRYLLRLDPGDGTGTGSRGEA